MQAGNVEGYMKCHTSEREDLLKKKEKFVSYIRPGRNKGRKQGMFETLASVKDLRLLLRKDYPIKNDPSEYFLQQISAIDKSVD